MANKTRQKRSFLELKKTLSHDSRRTSHRSLRVEGLEQRQLLSVTPLSSDLSYAIVDTGQNACYNNTVEISAPAEGAAFYGQDAQYDGYQPSYSASSDGLTVDDNVTGLTWTQSPDLDGDGDIDADDKLTYSEFLDYVDKLNEENYGGYSDWRAPTIEELYSLINFEGTDPNPQATSVSDLTPFIDTEYFAFAYGDLSAGERIIDAQFWSTTEYVSTTMDGDDTVFGVNFADGRIKGYGTTLFGEDKTEFAYFVRGNTDYGINDFADNEDGTITDSATGLMWSQDDSGVGMDWEDALAWVEEMNDANYLGYSDWRLPNAKELQSIVDYTRSPDTTSSAAIDPLFNCTAITNLAGQSDYGFYWSGTTHVRYGGSATAAVYISFGRGLGSMDGTTVIDVHGAGCQRSDPKSGDSDDYPSVGNGPQGDVQRVYNFVRLVRDAEVVETENTAPTADAGGPYSAETGETITLDATDSADTDGTIALYAWDLDGDGQYDDATGATVQYSATTAGSYTVGLQVTDNDGATATDTAAVTISAASNVAPTADAGGPYSADAGDTITLDATGSSDTDGTIALYEWDLDGDGQYDDATGITAQYSANLAGTYTVGLQVTDNDGATATDTATLIFGEVASSFEGYTLFTAIGSTDTYLIDNDGTVVHSWTSDYAPALSAYLLEDGTLVRTASLDESDRSFITGGAGGRVELWSWDGELLWEFEYSSSSYCLHHDIEVLPNGNILMIAWELVDEEEALAAGRDSSLLSEGELWPDSIIEVEPTGTSGGNIVWEWHVWDHLVQDYDSSKENYGVVADHPELIDLNYEAGQANADWTHINSIDYNEELDQILLSVHGFSEIWAIDHSTTTEEAASHSGGDSGMGGDLLYRWGNPQAYDAGTDDDQMLFSQHDAEWIDDGLPGEDNILVFNNGSRRSDQTYSSVVEIDPPVEDDGSYSLTTGEAYGPTDLVWSYTADPAASFFADHISGSQRLANGNTLITNGTSGTLFEVSASGEIVWEYEVGSEVFRADRYALDYSAFDGTDLDDENTAPTAEAGGPYSGYVGDTITLDATGSSDTDGSITLYEWDLDNDGQYDDATGSNASFVSSSVGSFTVGVRVTDDDGATATDTATVVVSQTSLPTLLSSVDDVTLSDLSINGTLEYLIDPARDGFLTVLVDTSGLQWQLLDAGTLTEITPVETTESGRADYDVDADATYLLRLTGRATDAELRLVNLVEYSDSTVYVYGTDDEDTFVLDSEGSCNVTVNGVDYSFDSASVSSVQFDGQSGGDQATISGTSAAETIDLSPSQGELSRTGFTVSVANTWDITVDGGGGDDVASLVDSDGDDTLVADSQTATMTGTTLAGEEFSNTVVNVPAVHAYARNGGYDSAVLYGTAGKNDVFKGYYRPDDSNAHYGKLRTGDIIRRAKFFDSVVADGGDGEDSDRAVLLGETGNDTLEAGPGSATLSNSEITYTANDFSRVLAYAADGGDDTVTLTDSAEDDEFRLLSHKSEVTGSTYEIVARAFDHVIADATQFADDTDEVRLYDSAMDDTFTASAGKATMAGGVDFLATGFQKIKAYSLYSDDYDTAVLEGSNGDDTLEAFSNSDGQLTVDSDRVNIWGSNSVGSTLLRAAAFEEITAKSGDGDDSADGTEGLSALDYVLRMEGQWGV